MLPAVPRSICPKIVTVLAGATSANPVITQAFPSTKHPISPETVGEFLLKSYVAARLLDLQWGCILGMWVVSRNLI